jgi:serine/threonine protein phosphatase PrpC
MNIEGKVEVTGLSDVGRKRSHNEDSIGSDTAVGLTVLADGMGGYKAGEVASAMAVNGIMEVIRDRLQGFKHGSVDDLTGFTRESLLMKEAVERANQEINSVALSQPQCAGMGTTLVAAMFYDDRVTIAHVGDSRLYRMRKGNLEQITVDHSLLQELVDKGFYTPEEAKQSLNKNLVTRAMGIESTVVPDVQEDAAIPGDIYLLCSDGLTDLVEDDQISLIIEKHSADLDKVASNLVQLANENGGKDNISVILARVLKPFPSSKRGWYSKFVDWFS